MKVSKAVYFFQEYQKVNSKRASIRTYSTTLSSFSKSFETRELESVSAEEMVSFLRSLTDGRKQVTKHARYSHLRTLFTFIREDLSPGLPNPCDAPMLKKLFRCGKAVQWDILEKETVDEIIFRTTKARNRIMLELMARGGMRIGEVLNLTP